MKKIVGYIFGTILRFGVLAAVLGGGFVFGGALIAARTAQQELPNEPLPVEVTEVIQQETYVATRKFAGRIAPQQVTDVGFQLGGQIVEILVEEGAPVAEGQGMAVLDTEQLINRRDDLTAQAREVEAQLDRAEATLKRTQELVEQGFSSRQALDNIRAERDSASARADRIAAQISGVETDIADATIRAPFSGQVVRQYLDSGSVVQPGQSVFRINESGVLEARIGIPITFRSRVQIGERFDVSAGALTTTGTITAIVSDVNTQTRTLTVILKIDDDPGFVARDLVRLSLTEEIRETGIWVPAKSLHESLRGLWSVFTVTLNEAPKEALPEREGRLERKDVEVIHIEEDRVFVRGTLEHGDLVVSAGTFRFVPGQTVRIARGL